MSRRAPRVALALAFLLILVASTVGFVVLEQEAVATRRTAREFDAKAREVHDALTALRTAWQAAVRPDQDTKAWLPRAADALATGRDRITALRQRSADGSVLNDLDAAAAALEELTAVHQEIARLLRGDLREQAAALAFGQANALAVTMQERVESARASEAERADTELATLRAYQIVGLGTVAAISLIVVGLLVAQPDRDAPMAGRAPDVTSADETPRRSEVIGTPVTPVEPSLPAPSTGRADLQPPTPAPSLPATDIGAPASTPVGPEVNPGEADPRMPPRDRRKAPELRAAADLCTDFARLADAGELPGLLERTARVLDATGFIIWLADEDGATLRPALAHGYPPATLARLPAIPRDADNATAAAFRRSEMEIVQTNGMSPGAIVVPLLGPSGCVGVMAAEVRHGREASESARALARIVAAQISTLVGSGVAQAGAAAAPDQPARQPARAAG